jgi:membrane protein DedA with SNARE-associated domain
MWNAADLIDQWGYEAIFAVVILGNLGFPVPEEGILVFAGYLVWTGKLGLWNVLMVAISAAVIGDCLGYWFGRHYGQAAIRRFGHKIFITEERLYRARQFVCRYGSYGVFIARFIPGLRFMAGPVAGSTGLPFAQFLAANVMGGLVYVPISVGAGYFLGQSLGDVLRQLERMAGKPEYLALMLVALGALLILAWRALSARHTSEDDQR